MFIILLTYSLPTLSRFSRCVSSLFGLLAICALTIFQPCVGFWGWLECFIQNTAYRERRRQRRVKWMRCYCSLLLFCHDFNASQSVWRRCREPQSRFPGLDESIIIIIIITVIQQNFAQSKVGTKWRCLPGRRCFVVQNGWLWYTRL